MQDIRFQAIVSSPIDIKKISHIVKRYNTCTRKYKTAFKKKFESVEDEKEMVVTRKTEPPPKKKNLLQEKKNSEQEQEELWRKF